jgi:hypothetical protein
MACRRTKFKNYVDEEVRRKNTAKSRVTAVLQLLYSESTLPSGFFLKKKPHLTELVRA